MLELFFILVVLGSIALPIIVIATENSGKRANRQKYILVFLAYVLSILAVRYSLLSGVLREVFYLEVAILLGLFIWLFRATVQRVRDIGRPKALAYVAAIPIVGFLFQVYLTFPTSVPRADH